MLQVWGRNGLTSSTLADGDDDDFLIPNSKYSTYIYQVLAQGLPAFLIIPRLIFIFSVSGFRLIVAGFVSTLILGSGIHDHIFPVSRLLIFICDYSCSFILYIRKPYKKPY
jgi:hypothetical protein